MTQQNEAVQKKPRTQQKREAKGTFQMKKDKESNSRGQQNGHLLGQVDGVREFTPRGR